MTTVTPSMARGIHVRPRNPPFEFDPSSVPEAWLDGDPVLTAAWNSLSVVTAAGEKLFLEAGRWLLERIDDEVIAAETRAFLQQEAMHSAVHVRFNRALAARGLPVEAVERYATDLLGAIGAHAGHATMLSAALAGEQLVGEMGHAILERPDALAHAAPGPRALWTWHFYEEVEHQAALHDGWVHVFGSSEGARTSRMLGAAYVGVVIALAWPVTTWAMLPLERPHLVRLPLAPTYQHFLGDPGLLRGAARNLRHLVRRDFHPFQLHDPRPALTARADFVDPAWERPRPPAGRHGTQTDVPELPPLRAKDLAALAAYTRFATKRTRELVAEIRDVRESRRARTCG